MRIPCENDRIVIIFGLIMHELPTHWFQLDLSKEETYSFWRENRKFCVHDFSYLEKRGIDNKSAVEVVWKYDRSISRSTKEANEVE